MLRSLKILKVQKRKPKERVNTNVLQRLTLLPGGPEGRSCCICRRPGNGIGLLKLSLRLELPEAPDLTPSQFFAKLFLILNGEKIRLLSAWGKI